MLIGALEIDGTETVCATGMKDGTILEQIPIPTITPEETAPKLIEYFKDKKVAALDVGAFGPADASTKSETFGCILDTPRLAWRHKDLIDGLRDALKVSVGLDTGVSGSCLGEVTYGCTRGLDNVIYIIIGAGAGMSVWVNGGLPHGILYPEDGHVFLVRHPEDPRGGICPYHENCLESFVSGPSIEERWDKKVMDLVGNKEAQELESYYTAQSLVNYILLPLPRKIISDGGVMRQMRLFPTIREKVLEQLNGYINTRELQGMENYIVPASLDNNQDIMGCVKLGLNTLEASH